MPVDEVEGVEEEGRAEAEAETDQVRLGEGVVQAGQLSLND